MGASVEPARADLPPGALTQRLLAVGTDKARAAGCRSICLDLAADSAAVSRYQHLDFETKIQTRMPFLKNTQQIGMHHRMVRSLEPFG